LDHSQNASFARTFLGPTWLENFADILESSFMQPRSTLFEPVILVADDQEDDVILTRQALVRANVLNPLQVARDGEEAIQYLLGTGKFENRAEYPLPDLMLLDLNMPRMNGFEVLRWVRSHPTLRGLRIVVVSTSADSHDIDRAHELGANAFLVKVGDFKKYCAMLQAAVFFWLEITEAPLVRRPGQRLTEAQ
jgi:CheY-like chemotaxis protein